MRSARTLATAAIAVCAALGAGIALAAQVDCAGSGPTCNGTSQDDQITGSPQRDLIFAKGGRDYVEAGPAADVVHGQAGSDSEQVGLNGGNGDDTIYGEGGADYLSETSTSGRDTMFGGDGDDYQLEGGPEGDFIHGGPGDDGDAAKQSIDMFGDEGPDRIWGDGGRDAMEGEQGADRMYGGRGNDYIDALDDDAGAVDIVRCGKGKSDVAKVGPEDDVSGCETLIGKI